jgi:transcription elongation factor Elf1
VALTNAQVQKLIRPLLSEADPSLACPVCDASGLSIARHPTPPHAEWFDLSCKSCGLSERICLPRGTPMTHVDTR